MTKQCHTTNTLPVDFPLSTESLLHGFVSIVHSKELSFRGIEDHSVVLFFLHVLLGSLNTVCS